MAEFKTAIPIEELRKRNEQSRAAAQTPQQPQPAPKKGS